MNVDNSIRPPPYGEISTGVSQANHLGASILPSLKTAAQVIADLKQEVLMAASIPARTAINVLSFLAGASLGAFTALAVTGIMISPIGWGIAAGALAIALAGIASYGDPFEFVKTVLYAIGGFGVGFAIAQAAISAPGILKPLATLVIGGPVLPALIALIDHDMNFQKNEVFKSGKSDSSTSLGISYTDISKALLGVSELAVVMEKGVLITDIGANSLARNMGLRADDIILESDGEKVDLQSLSSRLKAPNKTTEFGIPHTILKILRDGKQMEIDCICPKGEVKNLSESGLSGTLETINGENGVLVTEVKEGGIADRAGVKVGDFITKLYKNPIKSLDDFDQRLSAVKIRKEDDLDGSLTLIRENQKIEGTYLCPPEKVVNLEYIGISGAFENEYFIKSFLVTRVAEESIAQKAGIQVGDIIKKYGNEEIYTLERFAQKLQILELAAKKEGSILDKHLELTYTRGSESRKTSLDFSVTSPPPYTPSPTTKEII